MILSYAEVIARKPELADLPQALVQMWLDAAEEAIIAAAGPLSYEDSGTPATVEEIITPRGPGTLVMLARRADSITSVIEGTTTLAADDFELRQGGRTLRRLDDGTNPASYWRDRLDITYEPMSEAASRERVQLALVQLDRTHQPGVVSQRIGEWQETYAANSVFNYEVERKAILASLNPAGVGIW